MPEAPTFSGETAESLQVSWSEPDNTGPAISDYDVQYREKGTGRFIDGQHAGPGLSLMLDDLEQGTVYEVQVRATNDEGTSDWSESGEGMTITPLTVGMTTDLPPPVEGAFSLRFSFSEPVRGFSANDIETGQDPACMDDQNTPVLCGPAIGGLETIDDRIFTTTVTPVTDGVAHNYTLTITVQAITVTSVVGNKPNEAAALEVRIAPPGVTVPISSIGLSASPGNGQVALRWNAPQNTGGAPIVRYEYRWAESGGEFSDWMRVAPAQRSETVRELTNGTEYVFEVRGVNALGKGSAETAMATPVRNTHTGGGGGGGGGGPRQTVPGAPTNVVAEGTDGAVVLTWEAPEDDDGAPITDYEYRIDGKGQWISIGSTDTTHTVTGLVNDTAYVFQVRAVNRVGRSPASDPVEADAEDAGGSGLYAFRQWRPDHIRSGAGECGCRADPTHPLFLRPGRPSHGLRIVGGYHGRPDGHRGRRPDGPDGDGAAGRTHHFNPRARRAGERIGESSGGRSHGRVPAL